MSKECQHEFTDIAVCVHCGCDTDGFISSRRTEPKGQGGLVAEFTLRREPSTKGYDGHDDGCDCAVCDDIAFKKSVQKGFMSIAEVHEHTRMQADELDDALGKIARLQVDLHQTVVDCEKYKSALKKIARGTLEPGHVYEQAVMMQDIAIKVLQEEHGCTVMGAKVCFACGECDPLTSDDLGKNCGGAL